MPLPLGHSVGAFSQAALLLLAAGAFGVSFALGLARLRAEAAAESAAGGDGNLSLADRPCRPGMSCFATFMVGLALALTLLVWRWVSRGALTFDNDLNVFLLLGLMLAGLLAYFRLTQHLLGLALFLVPMIALVLAVGGILTLLDPDKTYDYHAPLAVVHVLTIVGGSLSFAAGCVGGVVYLVADRQLRRRGPAATHPWIRLPPLATMEKFNQRTVLLGFPLLTLAIVTGFIRAFEMKAEGGANHWALLSKVALSLLAWIVYAPLVHIRLMPSFRGKRAAWLSIIGFALLLSVYFASNWIVSSPK